jgi:hypothetical protein
MRLNSLVLAVLLSLVVAHIAVGQEASQATKKQNEVDEEKVELPVWRRYLEASMRDYTLDDPADPNAKFTLTDRPAFIHAEPLEGEERGLLYLWKDEDGRPVAAITGILMRFSEGDSSWHELHEFHSLWDVSIGMHDKGRNVWQPSEAGVTWEKFNVDSKVGKTERLRQLQMKKVARRFEAKMNYKDRGEWNLRMIDKPIYNYTYQNENKQSVSGGVFTFCRSTDPEVLLLIESRSKKDGEYEWFWTSACFSDGSSFLSLDGREVWSDDPPRFSANYKHASRFKNREFNFADVLKKIESEAKATGDTDAKSQDPVKSK